MEAEINITPGDQWDSYWVNEKHVYKDTNGNWIASPELTQKEKIAFLKHTKKNNA